VKCIFIIIVVVFVLACVCVPVPVDHHHESACQSRPGLAHCNGKAQGKIECPASEVFVVIFFPLHRACKSSRSRLTFRHTHVVLVCVPIHLEGKRHPCRS